MAFKLFKNGDDLYEQGNELIKRGEFSKARGVLQKSIDKEGGEDDSFRNRPSEAPVNLETQRYGISLESGIIC